MWIVAVQACKLVSRVFRIVLDEEWMPLPEGQDVAEFLDLRMALKTESIEWLQK